MAKHHLSLIFYFVIIIVILASCTAADTNEGFDDEASYVHDKLWQNKEEVDESSNSDAASSLQPVGQWKFRRDSPYSRASETNNNEADSSLDTEDFASFDDARIRYIFDHMQTRDVNGQTAATNPTTTDTSNGKLIPCFIH